MNLLVFNTDASVFPLNPFYIFGITSFSIQSLNVALPAKVNGIGISVLALCNY
jgi:hypothetical protein